MREPQNKSSYHLYLPAGYDPAKKYPLVVAIHGLKPFDAAVPQRREWESIADTHGYVVIAPEMHAPDLLFGGATRRLLDLDSRQVLACMDHVATQCSIDTRYTFVTCWSFGGYIAHYLVNQHGERFAGFTARGAGFPEQYMDPQAAAKLAQRDFPILIFWGQNDMAGMRTQSQQAIQWYRQQGIDAKSYVVPGLGHERRPDISVAFFDDVMDNKQKLEIVASGPVGYAPFLVRLSARVPQADDPDTLTYRWTLDDRQIGSMPTVIYTLQKPGEYIVRLDVTDQNGTRYSADRKIVVFPAR